MAINTPNGIANEMRKYDIVTILVDKNNNYTGMRGISGGDIGSVSKHSFSEDVHDLGSFYSTLGGKAQEKIGGAVNDYRNFLGSVELGGDFTYGIRGLNFSLKGGANSTSPSNMGFYGKIDAEFNLNNINFMDLLTPEYGGKFAWSFKGKDQSKASFSNKYIMDVGAFRSEYLSNGDFMLGYGFGTPKYGAGYGFSGQANVWSWQSPTYGLSK